MRRSEFLAALPGMALLGKVLGVPAAEESRWLYLPNWADIQQEVMPPEDRIIGTVTETGTDGQVTVQLGGYRGQVKLRASEDLTSGDLVTIDDVDWLS